MQLLNVKFCSSLSSWYGVCIRALPLAVAALVALGSISAHALDVNDIRVGVHAGATRLVLELSHLAEPRIFGLPDPYRVVLDLPEVDREQIKAIVRGIEHKRMVLRLLDDTMTADGVQVFIGAETKEEQMRNCAVVASPYGGSTPLGTLGVIGPSNMDYPRVIALVDFTAGILTRALKG